MLIYTFQLDECKMDIGNAISDDIAMLLSSYRLEGKAQGQYEQQCNIINIALLIFILREGYVGSI